ncbi:MAG: LytTR family transcriptional regulator [Lachnospiraceae bacterium]|nr:LytTR family transcriptional regulator [Lachnospiraceae bacterium]
MQPVSLEITGVGLLHRKKGGESLKIEIHVDENAEDLLISVTCRQLTPEIEKMLASLRMMEHQLTVRKNGEIYFLDAAKVIYMESVERKCFVYTTEEIYESDFKLYELEQQLETCGFFRVSRSCLIHLKSIRSLKADINRRVRVTMSNGEQIIASRQYADALKRRLGVR